MKYSNSFFIGKTIQNTLLLMHTFHKYILEACQTLGSKTKKCKKQQLSNLRNRQFQCQEATRERGASTPVGNAQAENSLPEDASVIPKLKRSSGIKREI
jgi:hypothetical protein